MRPCAPCARVRKAASVGRPRAVPPKRSNPGPKPHMPMNDAASPSLASVTESVTGQPWQAWSVSGQAQDPLDERALSKLRWRCRRGLLENDLFIERFFRRYESRLTVGQARGMYVLMDLSDNDLLDLLLRRKALPPEIGTDEVRDVLEMLRS